MVVGNAKVSRVVLDQPRSVVGWSYGRRVA